MIQLILPDLLGVLQLGLLAHLLRQNRWKFLVEFVKFAAKRPVPTQRDHHEVSFQNFTNFLDSSVARVRFWALAVLQIIPILENSFQVLLDVENCELTHEKNYFGDFASQLLKIDFNGGGGPKKPA